MNKYIGRCQYCGEDHDLRVACAEYVAFKNMRRIPKISKFKLFLAKVFGRKDEFTMPEG